MSIAAYFITGGHKQNLGHFANLVKIAKIDNVITEGEEKFLKRTARRLNITDDEYKAILKKPESYPINPPVGYDASIERLYRLTQMIYADETPSKNEVNIIKKAATALGFPLDNVDKVCSEAVHLVMNTNNLEDFTTAIKKVNAI
ncbi:MAG: TerB family tellurite resistance protein [Flavobacteriaceae bacterium]|nr:TerB family tellurite resistance protein [Flavobacteriaceae bacterium]